MYGRWLSRASSLQRITSYTGWKQRPAFFTQAFFYRSMQLVCAKNVSSADDVKGQFEIYKKLHSNTVVTKPVYMHPLCSYAMTSATMLTNYVIEQYEPIALAYVSFKLQKVLKVILWHVEGKIVNFKRAQLDKLSLYVYDLYTGGTAYWPSSIKETKELTNSAQSWQIRKPETDRQSPYNPRQKCTS